MAPEPLPDPSLPLRSVTPELIAALTRQAEPLPEPEDEAFGAFFDRFGDARVVLLGEGTHGTSEFYRARAAVTRRLIERHGFNIVAIEGDWPDAARIDDYVRHHARRPWRGPAFQRFPTWMWRNIEVAGFVDWLRGHNEKLAPEDRASFHGLDIYSLGESIHAVLTWLDRVNPEAAAAARRRYDRLTPWQDEPASYGRSVVLQGGESAEEAVVAQLRDLLARRLELIRADREGWFDAVQNARVVRAAEGYYRAMYHGSAESWNLRDRHMFSTLQALLAHRGDAAKAVVWAHNSHVGNAQATAMGWQGEFNIGELCRMAHGDEAVLIGFGTDSGTVAAASDWDGPKEIKTVRPARTDSYEHAFLKTGHERSLTTWRGQSGPTARLLHSCLLRERAIGVIYRPETELQSHYFEAALGEQFDAWVWFARTRAVTEFGHEHPHGAPETWPFGL